jgi:hypothetical protein
MTVSTTQNRVSYAGNGVTLAFSFPYVFFDNADLVVLLVLADGTFTQKVLGTDYTVTGAGVDAGGTVTMTAPPAAGTSLVVYRDPALTQPQAFVDNDPLPAKSISRGYDRLTVITQRIRELVNRSFRLSDADTSGASPVLPTPTANAFIGWNGAANGLVNRTLTDLITISAYGTAVADKFIGDGTKVDFTLSQNPGALANLDVAIGGITQTPVRDFTWDGATKLSFVSAPPAPSTPGDTNIYVRYLRALPQGTSDAASVGYTPDGAGVIASNAQSKFQEAKSVFDFLTSAQIADVRTGTWYTGDVDAKRNAMYAAFVKAKDYMLTFRRSVFLPDGWYEIGDQNLPFRNTEVPATGLLDFHGVALIAQSSAVTIATVAPNGADVLQLNAVQNFSVLGFPTLTGKNGVGATVGSNGCSITGGYDNLRLEIAPTNCPYVDNGTYIDGGKGLTIQTPVAGQAVQCGSLHAEVRASGCVFGFSHEVDMVASAAMRTDVDLDLVAKDCYIGAVFSAGAAASALTAGRASGVRIKAKMIDCQKDVFLARCPGVRLDVEIITTKSKAARQLGPAGAAWTVSDAEVASVIATYAHSSHVAVYGDKGACDYKIKLGGATAGASGLLGATMGCSFHFDLAGSPSGGDVASVDSGGNTLRDCVVECSSITCTALPTAWYDPTLANTLSIGPARRSMSSTLAGNLQFAWSDGMTVYHTLRRKNDSIALRSASTSAAGNLSLDVENHLGNTVAGFRNDGGIVSQLRATANSLGALKQVLYIYDNTGALVGYVPIYTSFA